MPNIIQVGPTLEQHWRTVQSEPVNRELKQQRRRRLRKRHLKSEFALATSRLLRQILANVFGVELIILKAVSKFRKRKTKLLPCVPVLDKT